LYMQISISEGEAVAGQKWTGAFLRASETIIAWIEAKNGAFMS